MVALRTTWLVSILLSLTALSRASTDQSGVPLTDFEGITHQNHDIANDSRFLDEYTQEDLLVMRTLEISCVEKGILLFNWLAPEANFRYDPKDVTYHLFVTLGEGYDFTAMKLKDIKDEFEKKKTSHYFEIKGETEYIFKDIKPTNKMYSVLFVAEVGKVMSDIKKSTMDVLVHGIVPKSGNYTYASHVSFEADMKLEVTTSAEADAMKCKIFFKAKKGKLPMELLQIAVNTTVTGTTTDGTVLVRKVEKVKFKQKSVIVTAKLADSSEIFQKLKVDSLSLAGARNETDDGRYEVNIFDIRIENSYPIFDGLTFDTMFNLFSKIMWGFSINWHCNRACPCFGGCCFCVNTPNGVKDVYAILHAGFRAEAKFVFSKEWSRTWEKTIGLFSSSLRTLTVWVSVVPVVFTYKFNMDVELELVATASITAEMGAWIQGDLQMGLRQRGSGNSFDPVKTATFSHGTWTPQDTFKASYSLSADAGLHLYATVLVYHLVGGRVGVKPGVSFGTGGSVTSSGYTTDNFDLDLYLKMPLAFIVGNRDVWTGEYTLFTMSLLPSAKDVALNTSGLGWCEGDCDNDNECNTGFRCFQRSGSESLTSCQGNPTNAWDYCVPMFVF